MSWFLSVNGDKAIEGVISIPRVGCWHADINLDASSAASTGPVTIATGDGMLTMKGYCFRFGVFADQVRMRIVGGTGGLRSAPIQAKGYQSIPIKTALSDLLSMAGESLSSTSDQGLLAAQLPAWSVLAQRGAGAALASILKEAPLGPQGQTPSWRLASTVAANGAVTFDGSFWVGYESWGVAPLTEGIDYVYEFDDATVGKVRIAPDFPLLLPGQTFVHSGIPNRQVTYVRHEIQARKSLRTIAYYET